MKKYEFTGETKTVENSKKEEVVVRQIRALKEWKLPNGWIVKSEEMGGWLQDERNLSHEGKAWIDEDTVVLDNAIVKGDAAVEKCTLHNNAVINGEAAVSNSRFYDDVCVEGDAYLFQSALYNHSKVLRDVIVTNSQLFGNTTITYSEVKDSSLRNVITFPGCDQEESSDKMTAHFSNTTMMSNHPIEIHADASFENVTLTCDGTIRMTAKVEMKNVIAEEVSHFVVGHDLVMHHLVLEKGCVWKAKFYPNVTSRLIGNEGEGNQIRIKSNSLEFYNIQMVGQIRILGNWMFSETIFQDYAELRNESSSTVGMTRCRFSDVSKVVCKPGTGTYPLIANQTLINDDILYVEKNQP